MAHHHRKTASGSSSMRARRGSHLSSAGRFSSVSLDEEEPYLYEDEPHPSVSTPASLPKQEISNALNIELPPHHPNTEATEVVEAAALPHHPEALLVLDSDDENNDDASWRDFFRACCCHSRREWMSISLALLALLGLLYFFLIGLELLSRSFRVLGGCTAESLLGSDANPVASLMTGILITAILQSSSTTTAIVVSLVGGGLAVKTAIYLVMGANIGTSVTPMLVSLAHMGDADEMERAFAGSAVVWVFKILTVVVLFPLELATGYLYHLTKVMLPSDVGKGEKWEGPITKIVSPLGNKIIIANMDMIEEIAESGGNKTCEDYYPVTCEGGVESFDTCRQGLIGCDSKSNACPLFFENGASHRDDSVSAWVCLVFALVLLILCLVGLVTLLRHMLLGASQRIIYKATNINAYLAMGIGCGATILVQSSSITISTLIPLVGIGVLRLEQMFPLVLGADVGTTFTALMAAMVSNSVDSLQVALVHLFFNLTGILLWYPVPLLRKIPLRGARRLGKATHMWKGLPITFMLVSFFFLPLVLLGISICFDQDSLGFVALGTFFLLCLFFGCLYFVVWWKCRNGQQKCQHCLANRQKRQVAIRDLPEDIDYIKVDMEYVKNEIGRLKQYAGLESHVPSTRRPPPQRRSTQHTMEADETASLVSLYESCRSKTWADVLLSTSTRGSPRSTFHSIGVTDPRSTRHSSHRSIGGSIK